jgi:hypothetical protein
VITLIDYLILLEGYRDVKVSTFGINPRPIKRDFIRLPGSADEGDSGMEQWRWDGLAASSLKRPNTHVDNEKE